MRVAETQMTNKEFNRLVTKQKPLTKRGKGGRAFKVTADQNAALVKLTEEMKRMLHLYSTIKVKHSTLDSPRQKVLGDAVAALHELKKEFDGLESWLTGSKEPSH